MVLRDLIDVKMPVLLLDAFCFGIVVQVPSCAARMKTLHSKVCSVASWQRAHCRSCVCDGQFTELRLMLDFI